jgi:hypothetical protein
MNGEYMQTASNLNIVAESTTDSEGAIQSGIITGQVAGLIMAVVVMIVFTIFLGKGPLFPVQVIGSVIFGEAAFQGFHLAAFLTGLVLHQAGPSLLWGFVYGVLAGKFAVRSVALALMLGLGVGVVSMVGPYLLIPAVMKIFQGTDFWAREVPLFWDWAAHIVFGASFAFYPMIRKAIAR